MSCDEKVVKFLGEESKKTYSYTLLEEAWATFNDLMPYGG